MSGSPPGFESDRGSRPQTHLDFDIDPDESHSAIVADDAGSGRPGASSAAT